MKRLFLLGVALLLFVPFAFADVAKTYNVTIYWDDDNAKTQAFKWNLYMKSEGGTYGEQPLLEIPLSEAEKDGGDNNFKAPKSVEISGPPGASITKVFALKAFDGENYSEMSDGCPLTFKIPLQKPYNIRIIFNVSSE